jgi:hypothetical protein
MTQDQIRFEYHDITDNRQEVRAVLTCVSGAAFDKDNMPDDGLIRYALTHRLSTLIFGDIARDLMRQDVLRDWRDADLTTAERFDRIIDRLKIEKSET